jgi:hypothetical protein
MSWAETAVPPTATIAPTVHAAVQFLMAAPFAASTHRSLPGETGTAGDNWHQAKTGLFSRSIDANVTRPG